MDPAVFVFLVLGVCLGSLYFGFRGITRLFTRISGWDGLEKLFGCDVDGRIWTHHRETVQVKAIRYRRCVSAGVQADGLYLRIASIFRSRAVRIPWDRLTAFQPVSIYGRAGMQFTVEGVAIGVGTSLYAVMYPHVVAAYRPFAGRRPGG